MADSGSSSTEESDSQPESSTPQKVHEKDEGLNHSCKCSDCDSKRAAWKKWKAAADLQEIFDLNRAFLKGEINITPYHLGGLAPETIDYALIEPLLQLHDYGLLTTAGQPCTESSDVYQTTETDPMGEKRTIWQERRQVAYLQFIIPQQRRTTATKKQIRSFFDALFKVHTIETMVSWPAYTAGDCKNFADTDIRYTHESSPLPDEVQRCNMDQYRSAPSEAQLVEATWKDPMQPPGLHVQGWEHLEEFPTWMLGMYPIIVHCNAAKWDMDFSLENAVHDVAQLHLPRVFQPRDEKTKIEDGGTKASSKRVLKEMVAKKTSTASRKTRSTPAKANGTAVSTRIQRRRK